MTIKRSSVAQTVRARYPASPPRSADATETHVGASNVRFPLTIIINALAPGTGLIILRREWLGFALALLYCVFAQIAILGYLLIPAAIPRYVTVGAAVAASAVWVWSQWLLFERRRLTTGEAVERELRKLSEQCADAIKANNLAEAHDLLQMALVINDEHLAINKQWASVMEMMGRPNDAARAWRRVLQFEHEPAERRAAERALADLPTG